MHADELARRARDRARPFADTLEHAQLCEERGGDGDQHDRSGDVRHRPELGAAHDHHEAEDQDERTDVEQALRHDRAERQPARCAEQHDAHQVAGAGRQRVVPHVADERQPERLGATPVEAGPEEDLVPTLGAEQGRDRVEAECGAEVAERMSVQRDVGLLLPRSPPDDPGESRQRDAGLQKAEPGPPRYVDARQTGRNVPTIPHLNATRGRLRPAAASPPRGCRPACRPGRRCRCADRCPPRRGTARATARTRASPPPPVTRWKTSERPTRSKSVPGRC